MFDVKFIALMIVTSVNSANVPVSSTLPSPVVVRTNNGAVRGRIVLAANGRYAQEFLSIPYAKPPVGPLRLRSPQPVDNWSGEHDGTRLGNACIQTVMSDPPSRKRPFSVRIVAVSEDCLTVNIHAPYSGQQQQSNALLPVLIWIYGGSFQSGSNTMALYNASILATEIDAIVVTVNYRLGSLGFFTLAGVDGVSGNQGLLDQALAMKWVRDNAEHFGGDPQQITLFGESAGSASVHYHTLSPISRDLFARSIMQSGTASSFWSYRTPQQARQASREFAKSVGCSDADDFEVFKCFQSENVSQILDANAIVQATIKQSLVPTTDGVFLKKPPTEQLMAGDFKRAPAIVGSTANETMLFLNSYWPELSSSLPDVRLNETQFETMLAAITYFVGNASREVMKLTYRNWTVSRDSSNESATAADRWRILNSIFDDCVINNNIINMLDAYLAAKVPIYRYRFDQISSVNLWGFSFDGAVHGDDIPFLFGHPLDSQFSYTKEEVELSRKILQMLGNFARTGDPNSAANAAGTPQQDTASWQRYSGGTEYFSFDATNFGKTGVGPERWRVEFWNRVVPFLENLEAQARTNSAEKCPSTG